MKFLLLSLLFAPGFFAAGAYVAPEHPWPFWDGQEAVELYAQRVSLSSTKTLDLGNGVKMDLVLIPAGKFIMGTPEPLPVDEVGFHKKILVGQALLLLGGSVLLVFVIAVAGQALWKKQRPKVSLARLIAITITAGVTILSGMHWWHSVQALAKAKVEYQAAKARFDDAEPAEKPAHKVTLTNPFYIGKYLVTEEQYGQVMSRRSKNSLGWNYPAQFDVYEEAQEFCNLLSIQAKKSIRMPTEAEWEYSCRAGTKTTYYSSDTLNDLAQAGWYDSNSSHTMHPVGLKIPNSFELFDMHGNAWEWCQDWYMEDYYTISPNENPPGPTQGIKRVIRGGNCDYGSAFSRSACRYSWEPIPKKYYTFIGLRVICVASVANGQAQ